MVGAYENVRIVDLSEGIAGSYTAMLLAETGADVIKVEPREGNPLRGRPGFHVWNRSKRSVALDLEEDRPALLKLLAGADVVISDFYPDEAKQIGLAYEDLSELNPALVYCDMPPMGSQGPMANFFKKKKEELIAGYAGFYASQWAYRDGPVYLLLPVGGYGSALLAASAVGAALYSRSKTGKGQRVEVSGLGGALALQFVHYSIPEAEGDVSWWVRDPLTGSSPVYGAYKASDGKWLFISAAHATFWSKLCIAMDMPELVADPRYVDAPWGIPHEHRHWLKQTVATFVGTRTRDECIQYLREFDVPCAEMLSREDFIDHPQVIANNMRAEVDDPELGKTVQMGVPVALSKTHAGIRGPAPRLGQHTSEILREPPRQIRRQPAVSDVPKNHGPLAGVRVVDFATFVAGGHVAKFLADFGAEVIKVETIQGDPYRHVAYNFASAGRGKRSIALDVGSEEGLAIAHELVRRADVSIENFRPGAAKRLGLDYEDLRQINPGIVHCSVTGWGKSGPFARLPAFDPLIQAMSGLNQTQGGKGQEPVPYRIGVMDHGGALAAVHATIAALHHKAMSGDGQLAESAVLNVGLALQAGEMIFYEGKPRDPEGGRDFLGLSAVRRLYQCKDGWVILVVDTAEEWAHLWRFLNGDGADLRFSWNEARTATVDSPVAKALEAAFLTNHAQNWVNLLREYVTCGPVLSNKQFYRDPQIQENGLFFVEEHPQWGRIWMCSNMARFWSTPFEVSSPSPTVGQHTNEILDELGFTAKRIADLRERRVVV